MAKLVDADYFNREVLGEEAVKALKEMQILIVGVGGLGSFVALELAHLGARNLIIADNDRVSATNLNRQILYTYNDVGKSKVSVAAERLRSIFPDMRVEAFNSRVDKTSAPYLVSRADLVIDCTDNFETKKLLNRVCYAQKKVFITAGVGTWEGWVATFPFDKREEEEVPCLECLFPGDLETLKEVGGSGQPTLVSVVGAVATVQVNEVAKLISGVGENLESKTLLVDMKNYQCVGVKINKNPKCPVCA